MGYNKFKAWLVLNGIKQEEIAKLLNVTRSTINKKIHKINGADFRLEEAIIICNNYGISADEIFLPNPGPIGNK